MPKRFTETTKWDDPWYLDLSTEAKLFWGYLCDKCDNAGVIDLSKRHAKFSMGIDTDIDMLLQELSKNLKKLNNGKLFLPSFISFQFGQLSEASNLHKNIILLLKKHGLYDNYLKGSLRVDIPLIKGTSKGKGNSIGKSKGSSNHLFINSEYFDLQKFIIEIELNEKYLPFDCEYYHECLINWSAECKMKKDWISTARTWMLRDVKDGKPKLKKEYEQKFKQNGKQSYDDKLREYLNRERNY